MRFNILPITAELADKWSRGNSQITGRDFEKFCLERLEHGSFTELEADMIAAAKDRLNDQLDKGAFWYHDILVDFRELERLEQPLNLQRYKSMRYPWINFKDNGATQLFEAGDYEGKCSANYAYEVLPDQLRQVKVRRAAGALA